MRKNNIIKYKVNKIIIKMVLLNTESNNTDGGNVFYKILVTILCITLTTIPIVLIKKALRKIK